MTTLRQILTERGARYGLFSENAAISNSVLTILRGTEGWQRLAPDQQVALEIIVQKIARILSGDPNYDDNWRDLAGYAQLIVDRLNGTGTYAVIADRVVTAEDCGFRPGQIVRLPEYEDARCLGCYTTVGNVHTLGCLYGTNIGDLGGSARS